MLLAVGFSLRALWLAFATGSLAASTSLLTANLENVKATDQAARSTISQSLNISQSINQAEQVQLTAKRPTSQQNGTKQVPSQSSVSVASKDVACAEGKLSAAELMMLTSLCPTGVEALPAQLLPNESSRIGPADSEVLSQDELISDHVVPPYQETASRGQYDIGNQGQRASITRGRITGLRVAALPQENLSPDARSQDSSASEGWLVSPEVWFGPDGSPKTEISLAEVTSDDAPIEEYSSAENIVSEKTAFESTAAESTTAENTAVENPEVENPEVENPAAENPAADLQVETTVGGSLFTPPPVVDPPITEQSAIELPINVPPEIGRSTTDHSTTQPAKLGLPLQEPTASSNTPTLDTPLNSATAPPAFQPSELLRQNEVSASDAVIESDTPINEGMKENPIRVNSLPAGEAIKNLYAGRDIPGQIQTGSIQTEQIQADRNQTEPTLTRQMQNEPTVDQRFDRRPIQSDGLVREQQVEIESPAAPRSTASPSFIAPQRKQNSNSPAASDSSQLQMEANKTNERQAPTLRPVPKQRADRLPIGNIPNSVGPKPVVANPESAYSELPQPKNAKSTSAEVQRRAVPKPVTPRPSAARPVPQRSLFAAPKTQSPLQGTTANNATSKGAKTNSNTVPKTPISPFGSPHAHDPGAAVAARKAADGKSAYESHRDLYLKNNYPSARDCAECHQKAYDEWSVSSHAYAYISPMFHKFEQKITDLSQGTVGHFCTRCHSPVTASMGLPRSVSMGELSGAQREGVTCIACHRVNERYGKTNGDRRIVPGSLEDPVYGGIGGEGVLKAIANRDKYKIKTSAADKKPGQLIHNEGRFFDQLSHAEACTSCHQVAVHPGVKLEVVWEQYRASPACKKGVTCQECHMGRIPGVAAGYTYGPIAEVGGKTVNDHRKQSNHTFYGPGYSIAHPGIFPQHKKADRWTIDEWLAFDWRGGWGTDKFEEQMEQAEDEGINTARWFPKVWSDPDDRYDAREIVEDNQKKLDRKRRYRELVMENGSKVDGPFFREPPRAGQDLKFDYIVANLNEGHNLPTASLGAQPQLWANVVLIGPDGRRLWETGYTDSKGDLCDIHSEDVRNGHVPFDSQLFNLQTMFLITGATGTDREFFLPVNLSFDQVAQLRPGALPITVLNHPPFIRMESRSLAPLGKKRVKYKVPSELVRQPGRYRLSFRLRNRTEPMFFMRFCESTQEMMRSMTEGTLDIHSYSVEFEVR